MSIDGIPSPVIIGVFGLGALQLAQFYENVAPSLSDVRSMNPGDDVGRQKLLDANMIAGSYAVALALLSYYATRSVIPVLMFLGAFSISALWRHLVLYSERF